MIPSQIQREKAGEILAKLLDSYGDTAESKVERFRTAIVRELDGVNVELFGVTTAPDRIVRKALRKANLDDASGITDVIMIGFKGDELVRYYLDGNWHEQ